MHGSNTNVQTGWYEIVKRKIVHDLHSPGQSTTTTMSRNMNTVCTLIFKQNDTYIWGHARRLAATHTHLVREAAAMTGRTLGRLLAVAITPSC